MDIFDLAGRRPEPDRWRGTVAEEHSGLYRGLEWRRGAVGGQAAETEVRVLGVLKSLTLCPSYTLLSVAAQYLLPLAVITVVYGKIYNFLKVLNYLSQQETINSLVLSQDRRLLNRAKKRKLRRTTGILLLISLVFCLRSWAASLSRKNMVFFSWLPFSILRILTELVVDLHEQTGNLSSIYY